MGRIRSKTPNVTGGGGGGPIPGGLVQWGPDFGDDSGNDGVTLTESSSIALSEVGFLGNVSEDASISMTEVKVESTNQVESAISQLEYKLSPIYADKDVFVGADLLCLDGGNHEGEDLQMNGLLSQQKEVLLGWDLSNLSPTATITEAILHVHWKANLIEILANDVDIFALSDSDENWNPSTVTCSTRPSADGAALQTFTWTPSGILTAVSQSITLNASVMQRISERMGVGNCTLLLNLATGNLLAREMEATDEGTDDDLGPRLELTWTEL